MNKKDPYNGSLYSSLSNCNYGYGLFYAIDYFSCIHTFPS
jgi:hypothetical protein